MSRPTKQHASAPWSAPVALIVLLAGVLGAFAVPACAAEASATAVSEGIVELEVPSSWEKSSYTEGATTYRVFTDGTASVQVSCAPVDLLLADYDEEDPDATERAFWDTLDGRADLDGATFGERALRSSGGVPIADIPYVAPDGRLTGIATVVAGAAYYGLVVSSFPVDAPAETIAAVQQVHASVAAAEGTKGSYARAETGPAAILSEGQYLARDQDLVSFVVGDVRYAVSTGGQAGVYRNAAQGTADLGVTVAVRNVGDEAVVPTPLRIEATGPSGVPQEVSGWEDGVLALGELEPGTTVQTSFYVADDGHGLYTFSLAPVDGDPRDAFIFTIEM